jgi:Domain of unknown function (DUF4129)
VAEETVGAVDGADFAQAHRDLLADSSIQFQFAYFQPPQVPEWLRWLGNFLVEILPLLRVIFWIAVAAVVLFILYVIVRRLTGATWPWKRKQAEDGGVAVEWRPEEAPARALLDEADKLAAEACYSEAAHLLLFRSIEEINSRRPELVRPALTSRDIAGAPNIPPEPRSAFSTIVALVERSLFGMRELGEQDWRQCRAAYESFAFAEAWR